MKRDPTVHKPAARLSDDELDAFYPACEPLDAACAGPRLTRLPPPCDEVGWLLLDLEPAALRRD